MHAEPAPGRRRAPAHVGYDAEVGVVGAGPAGARLAEVLAASGVAVELWDPRAPWEKPCGGGLTAAALRLVPDLTGVLAEAQVVWNVELTTDAGAAMAVRLDRPIHVVSRARLARWQLTRAQAAGAVLVSQGVRRLARAKAGWSVELRGGPVRHVRSLVGADGAASLVRAAVAPSLRIGLEPTRVAYPRVQSAALPDGPPNGGGDDGETVRRPGPAEPAGIRLRFARGVTGYAWDFPRPGHHSVGAAGAPGAATRVALDAEIDRTRPDLVDRMRVRVGAVIGSALHPWRAGYPELAVADDVALVGDAAGFADPVTGEGITNALRSAELAAHAYLRDRSFRRYPALAATTFEPEFRWARRLRYLLYDYGGAVRLIERAGRHTSVHALGTTLLNGANEHIRAVGLRWLQHWRSAGRRSTTRGVR